MLLTENHMKHLPNELKLYIIELIELNIYNFKNILIIGKRFTGKTTLVNYLINRYIKKCNIYELPSDRINIRNIIKCKVNRHYGLTNIITVQDLSCVGSMITFNMDLIIINNIDMKCYQTLQLLNPFDYYKNKISELQKYEWLCIDKNNINACWKITLPNNLY